MWVETEATKLLLPLMVRPSVDPGHPKILLGEDTIATLVDFSSSETGDRTRAFLLPKTGKFWWLSWPLGPVLGLTTHLHDFIVAKRLWIPYQQTILLCVCTGCPKTLCTCSS